MDPWVGKIPWRRAWQHTPVFLPENSMSRRAWWATAHRVSESDTTGQLSMHRHILLPKKPPVVAHCSWHVDQDSIRIHERSRPGPPLLIPPPATFPASLCFSHNDCLSLVLATVVSGPKSHMQMVSSLSVPGRTLQEAGGKDREQEEAKSFQLHRLLLIPQEVLAYSIIYTSEFV